MSHDAWALHRATNHKSASPHAAAATSSGELLSLPQQAVLSCTLGEALERRASCRRFSGEALPLETCSTLLAAAYGCGPTVEVGGFVFASRPVPSAGAKHPLQVHVLVRDVVGLPPGSYCYVPAAHALAPTAPGVAFDALAEILLCQPYVALAAAVVVLAGSFDATTARYGARGYRYVLFEAGHVAQNLVLAAAGVGIGALNVGGFMDDALANVLRLDAGVAPLYAVALGPPADGDREELRQLGPPSAR